jgi:biopolymer transport protein ExbD
VDSVYQLTFFLSLALLAIVITIFVLAVSLLGRAVKLSTEEQTKAEERRKKDTESKIKEMQGALEEARAAGHVDTAGLRKSIKALEKKDARHKWRLRWIKIKPKFLTADWGALIPGALFLIAAILSGLALNQPSETATASPYLWLSLIALGIGICFVCLTLKVIQGVAITSEETVFVRQKEMFKAALMEFEEEKKLLLQLVFEDKQPPFHVKANSEMTFTFLVEIIQGSVARNTKVYFFAPPGFEFIESVAGPTSGSYPNYVSAEFEQGDILSPLRKRKKVKIKTPSKKDEYVAAYGVVCEGFHSDLDEFNIVVE